MKHLKTVSKMLDRFAKGKMTKEDLLEWAERYQNNMTAIIESLFVRITRHRTAKGDWRKGQQPLSEIMDTSIDFDLWSNIEAQKKTLEKMGIL